MEEMNKQEVTIERVIAEAELIRNRERKISLENQLANMNKEVEL